jgi:two-component system response regulator RegA
VDAGKLETGLPLALDELVERHMERVLAEHAGNVSATARALGMHRRTLQRKLAKLRRERAEGKTAK